jgi:predicted XRE-type DNA-binding protein
VNGELAEAARAHRAALAAQKALSEAAQARDEAVRAAVAAGKWSQAEIARSLHVDRARINRIIKEK